MISRAWASEPHARPSFSDLIMLLEAISGDGVSSSKKHRTKKGDPSDIFGTQTNVSSKQESV